MADNFNHPEIDEESETCGHNNQFLHGDGSTVECEDCGTVWDTGARG